MRQLCECRDMKYLALKRLVALGAIVNCRFKEYHKLLTSKLYGHISLIQGYFIHLSSELLRGANISTEEAQY